MIYLVLEVDVFGLPLKREGELPEARWPVPLSHDLKQSLLDWNSRFGALVSAEHLYSPDDLAQQRKELNSEGEILLMKVKDKVGSLAKVTFLPEL